MNSSNPFEDNTKKVCTFSTISIFLIVAFVISPLKHYYMLSTLFKIIAILLLSYSMYANIQQTEHLRNASKQNVSNEIANQLSINIMCSYVFTLFIGLLIIFTMKTFV